MAYLGGYEVDIWQKASCMHVSHRKVLEQFVHYKYNPLVK